MKYRALAMDFDETLADNGVVAAPVITQLERVRESGRKLILVTGRRLADLLPVFPQIRLFNSVVAENGAVLYHPGTGKHKALGDPPDQRFIRALLKEGVTPVLIGDVIVATLEPYEKIVLRIIEHMGMELTLVFNKGAVMILPSGITKATGLLAALAELKVTSQETIGIGDGENDHAFLKNCACAVAVMNAVPSLKEEADIVLKKPDGTGIGDLIDRLLANTLHP